MDKYEELLNEIEMLKVRVDQLKEDRARLRAELTKALSLLSEWAPHTFEQHYMSAEQRASLERDENEAVVRRAALDALVTQAQELNMGYDPPLSGHCGTK